MGRPRQFITRILQMRRSSTTGSTMSINGDDKDPSPLYYPHKQQDLTSSERTHQITNSERSCMSFDSSLYPEDDDDADIDDDDNNMGEYHHSACGSCSAVPTRNNQMCEDDSFVPTSSTTSCHDHHHHHRHVHFGNVQVREYEQTIGDHPFCLSGVPLTLGWHYQESSTEPILSQHEHDDTNNDEARDLPPNEAAAAASAACAQHDQHSQHQRTDEDLRLSDQERHDRLVAHQVSELEIRRCLRRLHRERSSASAFQNNKCMLQAKACFFSGKQQEEQQQKEQQQQQQQQQQQEEQQQQHKR